MELSKHVTPAVAEDLSAAFKALGSPHRLQIVRLLLERDWACCERERPEDCALDPASCNVGELAERLRVAPSTTSHHLKELQAAGLLERVRIGRHLYCRVNAATLRRLREVLEPAERAGPCAAGEDAAMSPGGSQCPPR